MKLTLRQQWRLRPLSSFLGFLDLKTGVIVALLFALLNKVAGVYGLIAMLTGAGGSAAQLSQYIYSVLGLVALAWGLKAVEEEDPKRTLYFAHLFFADHVLSTAWTIFFAVHWWVYTPHDGRRFANSPAQQALIDGYIGHHLNMTEAQRVAAAEDIWGREKGIAATIIVLGWLSKFFFAALIYSFANHLRQGTYRSLPLSRPTAALSSTYTAARAEPDDDSFEEAADDFYSPKTATTPLPLHTHRQPASPHHPQTVTRRPGSAGSFADFVSAPPPPRRTRGSLLGRGIGGAAAAAGSSGASGSGSGGSAGEEADDEVLFDEEEAGSASGRSGSGERDRAPLMDGQAQGTARGGLGAGKSRRIRG